LPEPNRKSASARHATERCQCRSVLVERPRDQVATRTDDRNLPLNLETLVLVLDIEECAFEPIEAVVERAVIEAAFLDRNTQLLVERAHAYHGKVELDLHRRVDAPRQGIEKAQLLLSLGRAIRRDLRRRLYRLRTVPSP
jgi:hypothetical protein